MTSFRQGKAPGNSIGLFGGVIPTVAVVDGKPAEDEMAVFAKAGVHGAGPVLPCEAQAEMENLKRRNGCHEAETPRQ